MTYKSLVYTLFFVSGISGLMYEVVWLRMLARITGVTIYATATVLAAFMAGLALGSLLFGRIADKREDPLRLYAILEFIIACAAMLVPFIFALSAPLHRFAYQASGDSFLVAGAVRAIVSFVSLLVPATIMGGTLPVLTSCLVRRDNIFGSNLSLLYGLNTLGAVVGVLLSGFVTIGALGEQRTIYLAMMINLLVALIAFSLHMRDSRSAAATAEMSQRASVLVQRTISPYSPGAQRLVLAAFAFSGLTALAYEVVWTRQLILFLQTSIYAFSGMLAIYLSGIALGSIAISRTVDKLRRPLAAFGLLELAIGFLSVFNLYLFVPLDGFFVRDVLGLASPVFAAFVIVFPMTFALGMIFPIAGLCHAGNVDETGASVGLLYGANTVGAIFGSLLTGFVLIPMWGSTKTVIALACLNIMLGAVLLALERSTAPVRRWAVATVLLLSSVLIWSALQEDPFSAAIERRIAVLGAKATGAETAPPVQGAIYRHAEGIEGTVTAFSANEIKQLWINGIGMTQLCTETKLMAHIPLWFARDPKDFLVICFGMGTTVKSAAVYPDLNITAVELVPECFDTFPFFHDGADEILKRKNVRLVANDGRNFLAFTDKKFDVITVDPAPPIWSAGTVNLYSREFFELCKSHLTADGAMCLWFPGGYPEDDLSILKTFASVFPDAMVFRGSRGWGLYFVGTLKKASWSDFKNAVEAAYEKEAVRKDLAEYDDTCTSPPKLYSLLLGEGSELLKRLPAGALITDDYPYTEFFLWRHLFRN